MSEVALFDLNQRQMIEFRRGDICASAGSLDVFHALVHQRLEWLAGARLQPQPVDCYTLLDSEQNAAPSVMSGHTDAGLIGSISIVKFKHSVFRTIHPGNRCRLSDHMGTAGRGNEVKEAPGANLPEEIEAALLADAYQVMSGVPIYSGW
jgi:hypothetical protein